LRDVIRKRDDKKKFDTPGKSPASHHDRGDTFAWRAQATLLIDGAGI
jgi:hypothetical protein